MRRGVEFRFLPDQRRDQIGIEPVEHRILAEIGPVGLGKKRFPVGTRQVGNIDGEIVGRGALHDLDAAIVAATVLIDARHFGRRPGSAFLAGSGLQLAHGQIGERAVGKQARPRDTQIVIGRIGRGDFSARRKRRNAVEQARSAGELLCACHRRAGMLSTAAARIRRSSNCESGRRVSDKTPAPSPGCLLLRPDARASKARPESPRSRDRARSALQIPGAPRRSGLAGSSARQPSSARRRRGCHSGKRCCNSRK